MKRPDLDKKLKTAGWEIQIPLLPRHKEINEYTAKGILEAAGLE
ncbi:toxin-antitoxin system, toxin component, HicA family protein [Desulforamulus ruminis]|nr:toxin-antitoxin system, toxin component, HicA family protein [Desulforamulus ruminis]